MTEEDIFGYESCKRTADFIKSKISTTPELLIICGSGLGSLAETIENAVILKYEDIPNFGTSRVAGHAGKLVFGTLKGKQVGCMQGRFHYYEGYSLKQNTLPIRVFHLLGAQLLIVTNAAGGLNEKYNIGDLMILKDHINLFGFAGQNPLNSLNDDRFGPRFCNLNNIYDKELKELAKSILKNQNLEKITHEGTYVMVGGPSYESRAEVRALKILGADATGMSTIPEVLVAAHCGMKVFGFSLITNKAIFDDADNSEPNHNEVLKSVEQMAEKLKVFTTEFVGSLKLN